jgi:hypothetical protein
MPLCRWRISGSSAACSPVAASVTMAISGSTPPAFAKASCQVLVLLRMLERRRSVERVPARLRLLPIGHQFDAISGAPRRRPRVQFSRICRQYRQSSNLGAYAAFGENIKFDSILFITTNSIGVVQKPPEKA